MRVMFGASWEAMGNSSDAKGTSMFFNAKLFLKGTERCTERENENKHNMRESERENEVGVGEGLGS